MRTPNAPYISGWAAKTAVPSSSRWPNTCTQSEETPVSTLTPDMSVPVAATPRDPDPDAIAAAQAWRRTGPDRPRVRALRGAHGPAPELRGGRDPRRDVERALLLQVTRRAAAHASHAGQQVLQGPGENAGVVDIGDGWPSRSRWRATTTRPRSSRTTAPPPVSAASARRLHDGRAADRPPQLAALRRRSTAGCRAPGLRARGDAARGRRRASPAMATASAFRLWAARSSSIRRTAATRWSTRCASGCFATTSCARAPRRRRQRGPGASARARGATASTGRRCRRGPTRARALAPCRSVTLPRQAAHRGLPGAADNDAVVGMQDMGAAGSDELVGGDGCAGRNRHRARRRPRAGAASPA